MKILQVIILDKLNQKFGRKEITMKDLKYHLKLIHRIPKSVVGIVIADMINKKYLINVDEGVYRLRKNIGELIESSMEKYNLMRNKTFA